MVDLSLFLLGFSLIIFGRSTYIYIGRLKKLKKNDSEKFDTVFTELDKFWVFKKYKDFKFKKKKTI